jgi:mRNA-degrading endonuclease HigB of HigAB toxin-antitoxin module
VRLIGRTKLAPLSEQDRDTARWVASWTVELRDAHWKRPSDVAGQFPRVYRQNDGTFLFPVPQRRVGIHVLMAFSRGVALILGIRPCEVANGH